MDQPPPGLWDLPSSAELEQIAANAPAVLNPIVAYFVFEWRKVVFEAHPWGKDQVGAEAIIPDYVGMYGADTCVNWLLEAPKLRGPLDAGTITLKLVELMV